MGEFFNLLKSGSRSAMWAAIVNAIIAIIKGAAFSISGNVAMFAETMHSLGDAANQFFVFLGTALSKKAPTERFPNGFGRLINLVLLGAVIIVAIMSYQTIIEGFYHIFHPTESTGLALNIVVLGLSVVLESLVLLKAMKEVVHQLNLNVKGIGVVIHSIKNLKRAKPATKLVLLEDSVAAIGGLLALLAVLLSHYTPLHASEGIASVMIGLMMFAVVARVFLDNAAGVLGEADEEMEQLIGDIVMRDPDVKDIQELTVVKEGEELHVEIEIEVDPQLSIAEADDIKDRIEEQVLKQKGVTDVIIEFDENDEIMNWNKKNL